MKILCVEDGSVDIESIENGDIKNGKVLVYRQGAEKPFILDIPANEGVYEQMWKQLKEEVNRYKSRMYSSELENFCNIIEYIEKSVLGEE